MNKKKDIYEVATSNLFIKVIVGIFTTTAAIFTIYAFFQEKNIDFQYEIVSNTNVLDINAEIGKLDIIYDSISLKETNENLRLVNIRVVNKGNEHILKDYFDENDPVGLKINFGKFVEFPEIIEASNDYLKRILRYVVHGDSTITFSKIILESGEFFTIKLLILHNIDEEPQISSIGKIAGQNTIEIKQPSDLSESKPFLKTAFSGKFWIQIVRLLAYFIIIVIIIAVTLFISFKVSDLLDGIKRKKLIEEFKHQKIYQYNRMDDAIFSRYKKDGTWILHFMNDLTSNVKILNTKYIKAKKDLMNGEKDIENLSRKEFVEFDRIRSDWDIINSMLKDGLIIENKGVLSINKKMHKSLKQFTVFLKEKKKYNKHKLHLRYKN